MDSGREEEGSAECSRRKGSGKMKSRQRKCAVCMSFMRTGGKQTAVDDDADSHYMPHTP